MESSIQNFYEVAPLQIRKNIVRLHCLNPGQTRINGSNSFLIGSGTERILIDCGADRLNNTSMNYVNSVVCYLKENGLVITTILCTHFHDDHIGAIPDMIDAFRDELGVDTTHQVTVSKRRNHHWYEDSVFSKLEGKCRIAELEDNQAFEVEGAKVTSMFTPGHSDDHMCFLLDDTFAGDSPEAVIFTGDCVLGTPSGSFDNYTEFNTLKYMESLYKIREISEGKMICVGHSVDVREEHIIMEAKTKIENYIKVRLERRQQMIVSYIKN